MKFRPAYFLASAVFLASVSAVAAATSLSEKMQLEGGTPGCRTEIKKLLAEQFGDQARNLIVRFWENHAQWGELFMINSKTSPSAEEKFVEFKWCLPSRKD